MQVDEKMIPPEAVKPVITQEELKAMLHYDDATGVFTWRQAARNNSIPAGSKAGAVNTNGYLRIEIKGRIYMAHRLAWLYVTGSWPNGLIDHIDRCKTNNRYSNLRAAKPTENSWNCKKFSTNTSGVKGVSWHKKNRKWYARINNAGKEIHVGTFDTPDAAVTAVIAAREAIHGQFANHGFNTENGNGS